MEGLDGVAMAASIPAGERQAPRMNLPAGIWCISGGAASFKTIHSRHVAIIAFVVMISRETLTTT